MCCARCCCRVLTRISGAAVTDDVRCTGHQCSGCLMLRVNVVDVRSSVRVTNVVTAVLNVDGVLGTSGSPMWWIAILVRARPTNELDVDGW